MTWRITFLDGTTGETFDWTVSGGPRSFSTATRLRQWLSPHFAAKFDLFSCDEFQVNRVGRDWTFSCRIVDAFGFFAGVGMITPIED